MNWTQAICGACYGVRFPGRGAVALKEGMEEKCCDCGAPTKDGIYFRVDPRTVKFPKQEKQ